MKNCSYICGDFHTGWRGNSSHTDGYFYALTANIIICGSDTPVSSVNAPTAILVEVNGKGRNRLFIFGQNKHFIGMTSETRCLTGRTTPRANRTTHETGKTIPSNAIQFAALLYDLCRAKRDIDVFYESQTEGIMHDCPALYLKAETNLCDAIHGLAEYVGMLTSESFLSIEKTS